MILCIFPLARSLADTLTIPFASISNVTSICGTPRIARLIFFNLNLPTNIKNELTSFKKLTKKVDYETCNQEKFDEIKSAKINLESISSSLLSM